MISHDIQEAKKYNLLKKEGFQLNDNNKSNQKDIRKMDKKIFKDDRIFVAGATGMAGSAICRSLIKNGYGDINKGGYLLTPSRNELNLLNINEVVDWFNLHKPSVVVIAAAKVGGIFANSSMPTEFLLENLKIQTNIIETSWKTGVRRLLS